MSAAKVDSAGVITKLDGKAEPEEVVSEADVQDASKLAKMLQRMLSTVAGLRRARVAKRIDFYDITTTNGGTVSLQHNFNGRVVWWPIDYLITGAAAAPIIQRDATNTTANTLVLLTYSTGTLSLRVEAAG